MVSHDQLTSSMADGTQIAFGFLGGKEVQAAGLGNIGLYDREPTTLSDQSGYTHVIAQNGLHSNGFKSTFPYSEEIQNRS